MKFNITKKHLIKIITITLLSLLISFISGFFVSNLINNANGYYQASFTYEGNKDLNQIIDKEYLQSIKDTNKTNYASINISSLVDKKDISITKEGTNYYTITTKAHYYSTFFYSAKKRVDTRARTFIKLALTTYIEEGETITFDDPDKIVTLKNTHSPYIGGCIGLIGGIFASLIFIAYSKDKKENSIEDNKTLFHTPFHKEYWKNSLTIFKDTKKMVVLAMLFSLLLVSKFITIPSGFGELGIKFGFIFLSLIALIYGPAVSLIIGALSDIVGYYITPQNGPMFIGYTIQACLSCFVYSLCFFRTKITFTKVLISHLIVNMLFNVILGSFLQAFIYIQMGTISPEIYMQTVSVYMLTFELPKNIVYLIPQTMLLFIIFKSLIPVLSRYKLIDSKIKDNITII